MGVWLHLKAVQIGFAFPLIVHNIIPNIACGKLAKLIAVEVLGEEEDFGKIWLDQEGRSDKTNSYKKDFKTE